MNKELGKQDYMLVSAGCHINDVMNLPVANHCMQSVSAGCRINDVMN